MNPAKATPMPSPAEIRAALPRIAPHIQRTPVLTAHLPGLRYPIQIKLENCQITGSFKARGAFNTLLSTNVPAGGVVAASGGNHGAAVATAARTLGHAAHIFVPEFAGPAKIGLIRASGAELTISPGTYQESYDKALAYAAETGAMQIHAYDAPATLIGQGTLALEWDEQGLDADTVLIAVGGGGLIGGALSYWQGARRVVAVEPELAPTLHMALKHGPETSVEVSGIAANALGARVIGRMCYDLVRAQNVPALLVTDAAIAQAQHLLWDRLRQYVEPAGATALAALLSGVYTPAPGEKVAVLVCGANPAPGPFG